MTSVREPAFAKVNLCLWLGGVRSDGRHELVTLFQSISLADELMIEPLADGEDDRVICESVAGPNLVADALVALRAAGWSAPRLGVTIDKRIPVAAGLAGGSADAAAMLRCAPRLAPVAPAAIAEIAARLGSDVPAQLDPGVSIGTGAGDVIQAVADLGEHAVLVIPQPVALSTAAVYREADRLRLGRGERRLSALRGELERGLSVGVLPRHLIANDLAPAARSLCPEIGAALALALDAGADQALVCGSGPTVAGIFWGPGSAERADEAAAHVGPRCHGAVAAAPVRRGTPAPVSRAAPGPVGRGTSAEATNI
jgi:4-diphosphocytidyl-2-C-methyl-D-erythritol kinase